MKRIAVLSLSFAGMSLFSAPYGFSDETSCDVYQHEVAGRWGIAYDDLILKLIPTYSDEFIFPTKITIADAQGNIFEEVSSDTETFNKLTTVGRIDLYTKIAKENIYSEPIRKVEMTDYYTIMVELGMTTWSVKLVGAACEKLLGDAIAEHYSRIALYLGMYRVRRESKLRSHEDSSNAGK